LPTLPTCGGMVRGGGGAKKKRRKRKRGKNF
jgi:hypothetical protein